MSVTNRLGRPMLAAVFIHGGTDQLRNAASKAERARPVAEAVRARTGELPFPDDTVSLVRMNGGVQVVAGSLLALNKAPRLAALALAGSLVPTTLAGHRFWEIEDEKERAHQRAHFLKNVAVFGALLIAAGDKGGRPSVAWKARHATRQAIDDVAEAIEDATSAISEATDEVTGRTRRFRRATSELSDHASDRVARSLRSTRNTAGPTFQDAGQAASEAISEASDALSEAVDRAQPVLEAAAEETRSRYRDLRKAARPLFKRSRRFGKRSRPFLKRSRPLVKRARPVAKRVQAESGRLASAAAQAGAQSKVAARNAVDRGAVAVRSTAA
ncbi:MAG: DoxX family membrane protein [Acidimicrobiales bacterium]|nr:DoxX family membrane protein [Acidimicrobiales bacterium]